MCVRVYELEKENVNTFAILYFVYFYTYAMCV